MLEGQKHRAKTKQSPARRPRGTRIILCGAPDFANSRAMEQPNQALEDARRAGIDLDLLDSNLALTYEERALRHESALELVLALREAGATYERPAPVTPEIR